MVTIINDLKEIFRRGDIHIRLIFINTIIFLAVTLMQIALLLFNVSISEWLRWVELPASLSQFISQPWSIITYMFMHAGVMHLLFNMLWLYWFGQLFLYFFTAHHLRGLYIWGGICGGLLYLLTFNVFPYFSDVVDYSYMVGASASVLAIVAAVAYREPNYRVNILLLGSIPLKYFAILVIGADLLFITGENAGGHIAHLGGAVGGLFFSHFLQRGTDLTHYINLVTDFLLRPFTLKQKSRKPKMKVNYEGCYQPNQQTKHKETEDKQYSTRESRIEEIRNKIKQSGYQGLSEEEKKELFNASIR
ncbi:MAG: rhomboid family intramembrane serine protease [Bacteroidaceae bacterium]|jgi:membrane associated rhomboid family serine protease|nr:rhomboid family intramembrane serine protease [Bacteroidaceae bacterium]